MVPLFRAVVKFCSTNRLFTYMEAKICFEMKIAKESKVNPKSFYKYLSSKMKIKPEIGNIILKNGKTAQSDKETAWN